MGISHRGISRICGFLRLKFRDFSLSEYFVAIVIWANPHSVVMQQIEHKNASFDTEP